MELFLANAANTGTYQTMMRMTKPIKLHLRCMACWNARLLNLYKKKQNLHKGSDMPCINSTKTKILSKLLFKTPSSCQNIVIFIGGIS